VPRRPGFTGMAAGDVGAFLELRKIFPLLHGWIPGGSRPDVALADAPVKYLSTRDPSDARYELAQSGLLLNASGGLPEVMLVDAALYGLPCIGTGTSESQLALWPELITDSPAMTVRLARTLLTNPAMMQRSSAQARARCLSLYRPNEQAAADSLRRLHAAHWACPPVAGAHA